MKQRVSALYVDLVLPTSRESLWINLLVLPGAANTFMKRWLMLIVSSCSSGNAKQCHFLKAYVQIMVTARF